MSEKDRPRGPGPLDEDDPSELGVFRGVVSDESITVTTVTEPPSEPAQPPSPGSSSAAEEPDPPDSAKA